VSWLPVLSEKHRPDINKGTVVRDWVYGFLKHRLELSLRHSSVTGIGRVIRFTKINLERYVTNWTHLLMRFSFQPHRILNMNENHLNMTPIKVTKRKDQPTKPWVEHVTNRNSYLVCEYFRKLSFSNIRLSQKRGGSTTSRWSSTTLCCCRVWFRLYKLRAPPALATVFPAERAKLCGNFLLVYTRQPRITHFSVLLSIRVGDIMFTCCPLRLAVHPKAAPWQTFRWTSQGFLFFSGW
jgi:hypothetical protein